jgi:hypothetical protein
VEGKRGPECLLKPVSNIDFNPLFTLDDINSNQLSNNGSSIYDTLGFHDEEEFLEDDLDDNSYDWN